MIGVLVGGLGGSMVFLGVTGLYVAIQRLKS